MDEKKNSEERLVWYLKERAKELNCLYRIEEILTDPDSNIESVCREIVLAIPLGWQYPELCQIKIVLEDYVAQSTDFKGSHRFLRADIKVFEKIVGSISVYYMKEVPMEGGSPFLKEEVKLIGTIAERLGNFVTHQRMRRFYKDKEGKRQDDAKKAEWRILLDLLRKTDRILFLRISYKMLNHLCWTGITEAQKLVQYYDPEGQSVDGESIIESNRPHKKKVLLTSNDFLSDETFKIAADHLTPEEILSFIQRWIQHDKLSFLLKAFVNLNCPVSEIVEAIRRYQRMDPEGADIPGPSKSGVLVSLIRRFFSDQLEYINIAKNFIEVHDFFDLIQNIIFFPESYGKLGGKSAGLFLATQILKRHSYDKKITPDFKVPKTWYITSDAVLHFVNFNNFEEVNEQRYKEIYQVRIEYPNVVQTFKNATFPPEIVQGLSMALDDFKKSPLVVRSSSLLEDRTGAAFSGKYKSLFLANQGNKADRLQALLDAVSEVYASVFGPDPIEYRAERGLLDFHEEMAIMIQEVVGTKIGKYFLPAYAGVAFSKNEFRWSPRIKREDGLVRLVPGLGTRAVDRLSDDYPVLVSPGQPGLRINITAEEISRYSPRKVDVINLETNSFDTIEISQLLKDVGFDYPGFKDVFSVIKDNHIQPPTGLDVDPNHDDMVVTFDGLFTRTPFLNRIQNILKTLEEKLDTPVDIEFASDGKNFYLLQCRPQSHSDENKSVPIPRDIPYDRIIFTANKFVSNGRVPDITHIVYIDPERYSAVNDRATLLSIGRAVGKLNLVLPKRQFILMGPGRWGSRGDIKLGVSVTYSDINNTAVLIEIARKNGNYVPDLSFGTHFFQDLVEANIRYLPLYPDDSGVVFNDNFLQRSPNVFPDVLPEYAYLLDTIKLIDIPSVTDGQILQILMNADIGEAVGMLTQPRSKGNVSDLIWKESEQTTDNYWPWRLRMAEYIASQIEPERFGVKGFYIFGSTKTGKAGPGSDIDIMVHFDGTDKQRELLTSWLEAWSLCLDQMNYLQTGYKSGGLLDVHIITDDDIERKTSYAVKIGAVTDAARPLPMKKKIEP
ncbi:MAG TPA: pyruvate, phosphate dikinase [candidate division Zixibacteria bacterium]|nr:pyruvate, phosphate dikinase [candidate division Zixibacteria bacterium]HBZ01220.1 pyruvate, phosphate dikinase [candidate division Zixibacteria bacterium]